MSGMIFIFFLWSAWIVSTFILNKEDPARLPIAALSLLLLIFSSVSFSVKSITVNGAAILLITGGCMVISKWPLVKKVYFFFSALTVMVGYTGFYLLELYDPVWVLIDRRIVLSCALYIVGYLLYPASFFNRFLAIVVGSLFGEVFLGIFLSRWSMPYTVGSMEYLDILGLTTALLCGSRVLAAFRGIMKQNTGQRMMQ
ncbi:hypothetical protein [Siminovitchia sp. 179-K 8D1 HS]|uniref:YphA family membrane protein n=1 Tax=Siminovitchia sp. 179-K 8D1 HS TaxID=3142385 RepID=UPI0039A0D42D